MIKGAFLDSDSFGVPDEGDAEVEHVLQALHHMGQETQVTLKNKYCWMPGTPSFFHVSPVTLNWDARSNYYESSSNGIRVNNDV